MKMRIQVQAIVVFHLLRGTQRPEPLIPPNKACEQYKGSFQIARKIRQEDRLRSFHHGLEVSSLRAFRRWVRQLPLVSTIVVYILSLPCDCLALNDGLRGTVMDPFLVVNPRAMKKSFPSPLRASKVLDDRLAFSSSGRGFQMMLLDS